jgi:hypothetical protein
MTQYVGLDVSLKETKIHVLDEAGNRVWRGRCATEPAAISAGPRCRCCSRALGFSAACSGDAALRQAVDHARIGDTS